MKTTYDIAIKNLKFSEFASEETYCFQATVYVNGKRAFIASNDGHGGCNNYDPVKPVPGEQNVVWDQVGKINEYLKTQPPVVTDIKQKDGTFWEYHQDLDGVITDLVNDALVEKEAKKYLRRISFVGKGGAIYQCPAKLKPTDVNIARVRATTWWKPDYVILNELPIGETIKIIRSASCRPE